MEPASPQLLYRETPGDDPGAVTVARNAMATRFEILLYGEDPVRLRAAGEEALAEIERVEARLSFYRPDSEISRINRDASRGPVRVSARVFHLLLRAAELSRASDGAFDITVAPLLRTWGFTARQGKVPCAADLEQALGRVGTRHLKFDETKRTVAFDRSGVEIELGAIGKGHALDQAVEILREGGISSALLHGGTSAVYALGAPPGEEAWKIAIPAPSSAAATPENTGDPGRPRFLAVIPLRDAALSVSAGWGKWFEIEGTAYTHILDPRTGSPVSERRLTAVAGPGCTDGDALSTGLLAGGLSLFDRIAGHASCRRALFMGWPPGAPKPTIRSHRIEMESHAE